MSKPTLVVMAIFRNEAHILDEWCCHYAAQGASRIVLLNHLSTDHYQAVLQPHIASGLVELIDVEGDRPQVRAYNAQRRRLRKVGHWLLVCDLDEFVYARHGHTLKSYLESLPWRVSEVVIPWKNFGSSHHDKHPAGLVSKNFLYRWSYDRRRHRDWCKYLVRTSRIRYLTVHYSSVWFGTVITPTGEPALSFDGRLEISEPFLSASEVHLNHYIIQSREFYEKVKMSRPDVRDSGKDSMRSWQYFEEHDLNEICDPELSLINVSSQDACSVR